MANEIERKFLISRRDFRELNRQYERIKREFIEQGYLAVEPDGNEVRLRFKSDGEQEHCFLTAKNGQGLVRGEAEVEVSFAQYNVLWPLTENRRVVKERFTLALTGTLKLELDRFDNKLKGLFLVEVEFPSEAEAKAFKPPVWFGAEVTDDKRFSNRNLATLESIRELPL